MNNILDDDSFWADPPPRRPGPTKAIAGYREALIAFFPTSDVHILTHPDDGRTGQEVCTIILGSHIIQVDVRGHAQWFQTNKSYPITLDGWLEANRPNMSYYTKPHNLILGRCCKSPADFRGWLNKVAFTIMQTQGEILRADLHQDNFLQDSRLALQCAHDLHLIRANTQRVVSDTPQPSWTGSTRPSSYTVKLLRTQMKSAVTFEVGTVFLIWDKGQWVHGITFNPNCILHILPAISVKFKGTSGFTEAQVTEAQQAAWRFSCGAIYEWLGKMAYAHPAARTNA